MTQPNKISLHLALSPAGHPYLHQATDEHVDSSTAGKLESYFAADYACGLLRLGISAIKTPHAQSITFWQSLGQLFISEARRTIGQGTDPISSHFLIPAPAADLHALIGKAPFMTGAEYLNLDVLAMLWTDMTNALKVELTAFNGAFYDYLAHYNPSWNKVGRVCFHLAENKTNQTHPFAFLATYTTRLTAASNVQHVPLGQALKEYAGEQNRAQLLALLVPVQKAAEKSTFIKDLLDRSAIFTPQAWTPHQAHAFLKEIPQIEESGVLVRVPNWWTPKHPPRPQISISVGNQSASAVGMNALLDFNISYSLPDGESLTYEELQEILARQENLVQIKGQWVEVDQSKLSHVLSHWQDVARQVKRDGLSFAEGLRLVAGAGSQKGGDDFVDSVAAWSNVVEGAWLEETLNQLRHPDQSSDSAVQTILARDLKATLRPYQLSGVQWLWWLYKLRLGGCLADDMGLGKTIQVLSLFLLAKQAEAVQRPHLLILPASLLGNWQAEIIKFAPSLAVWVAHGTSADQYILKQNDAPNLTGIDLVITTYSNVYRLPWIDKVAWNIVICDEAQSIKNPGTKQTLAIKKIPSQVRFILTGTPVENRLLDLWSLFDFVAPGLLGTSKAFSGYGKKKTDADEGAEQSFFASVRQLISPYILRRLKSDKSIIADLPDKTEVDTYCFLTKSQIGLYQQAVQELAQKLEEPAEQQDPMARRGLVLSYLMRLKQICNHPSQWLGHGDFDEQNSGKFLRLKELCEGIAAKQEKVLIFTQYREIIPALQTYLEGVFGRSGLILHGSTPTKERAKLVASFQTEQGPPFFILSIKAGGTGLTLTNASHVIHFDRWWNPAVENQATDRAYRIGQKKNVLVHKFICQGTIEEKIDSMINQKKALANDLLQGGGEALLTEMSNDELMKVVSLDIHKAMGDG